MYLNLVTRLGPVWQCKSRTVTAERRSLVCSAAEQFEKNVHLFIEEKAVRKQKKVEEFSSKQQRCSRKSVISVSGRVTEASEVK